MTEQVTVTGQIAVVPQPGSQCRKRHSEGRLKVKSTGETEYAWQAPQFTNFIWLRKVNKLEIKASNVYEIEMERAGEAKIFFVPIRSGE